MQCSCGATMTKIAESWTDKNGYRYISYRCPNCGKIEKIRA